MTILGRSFQESGANTEALELSVNSLASNIITLDNTVSSLTGPQLNDLTAVEADQLENINSSTITQSQWGILGTLDQDLGTTHNVQFNQLTIDNSSLQMSLGTPVSQSMIFATPFTISASGVGSGVTLQSDADIEISAGGFTEFTEPVQCGIVSESTPNSGVTVEGSLMKDNDITTSIMTLSGELNHTLQYAAKVRFTTPLTNFLGGYHFMAGTAVKEFDTSPGGQMVFNVNQRIRIKKTGYYAVVVYMFNLNGGDTTWLLFKNFTEATGIARGTMFANPANINWGSNSFTVEYLIAEDFYDLRVFNYVTSTIGHSQPYNQPSMAFYYIGSA